MNVIIMVEEGGATANPTTIPTEPVTKNITIKTFSLNGLMYLMPNIKRGFIIN